MAGEDESSREWSAVLERLLEGDPAAFARFNRLLSGFLIQFRAYDFREDWEDLRQEVLAAVVANHRAGRLRDPQAFLGYVRIIARNKFVDRLKRELRTGEGDALPWQDEIAAAPDTRPPSEEARDAWAAVRALPAEQRRLVEGVYLEGRSYREMCDATGLPLGTLKRRLRESLGSLRRRLGAAEPTGRSGRSG